MNQKGGTMVEAALVFPIIILSLMTVISILMFLFEEAASQAELHLVIRTEAGRQNGTFHGKTGSSSITVDKRFKGIYSIMSGKSTVTFEGSGMLPRPSHKSITGYQYAIDERRYARYADFFTLEEQTDGDDGEKTVQ